MSEKKYWATSDQYGETIWVDQPEIDYGSYWNADLHKCATIIPLKARDRIREVLRGKPLEKAIVQVSADDFMPIEN